MNRNFQHEYPYYDRDAGPHMVSEIESRALMDFMLTHRNIAAILTFGHSDNLVTPPDAAGKLANPTTLNLNAFAAVPNSKVFEVGMFSTQEPFFGGGPRLRGAQLGADNNPAAGRRPDTTVNRADLEYFKTVSDAYRSITGIKAVGVHRKPRGAFFQYGYYQFGVPSFTTPGWGLPSPASPAPAGGAKPPPTGDAAILAALESAGINAFVPWTAFKHPELGEVEIGGFRPYATTNPPAKDLAELGRKHGEFLVRLASMLPRVRIAGTEVKSLDGGLYKVTVDVVNTGFLPTTLQHGIVSGSVKGTVVQIQLPPETVIAGATKTTKIAKLDGSNARERISWVVRGKAGARVEIKVLAQKGGTDTATVTLQ
jgi:hypothetical protein